MAAVQTLYFDAFSGASGDMILGALVDLGGDFAGLRAGLSRLARGRFELRRRRIVASTLAATKIDVRITAKDEAERNFREIASIVRSGKLSGSATRLALEIFWRLCEAEAAVHGISFERVHLHEAGAIDAIADICGAAWLIDSLAPDRIVCSPLNVGSGSLECRHGTYPVPGPAAARLLRGVPVYAEGAPGERVTPTGAAILTTIVSEFRTLPPMVARAIGHGAGDRVFPDRPNVLRAILGEEVPAFIEGDDHAYSDSAILGVAGSSPSLVGARRRPTSSTRRARRPGIVGGGAAGGAGPHAAPEPGGSVSSGEPGAVVVIETTIDDMNPQNYGYLLEKALAAGALEVFFTPVLMKKGRPGTKVTVIASPERFEALGSLLFRETTTIGFRFRREARRELQRHLEKVRTPYGSVRIKVSSDRGTIVHAQPEYEDCRRLASAKKVPLKEVQRAALAAWKPPRPGAVTTHGSTRPARRSPVRTRSAGQPVRSPSSKPRRRTAGPVGGARVRKQGSRTPRAARRASIRHEGMPARARVKGKRPRRS